MFLFSLQLINRNFAPLRDVDKFKKKEERNNESERKLKRHSPGRRRTSFERLIKRKENRK